MKHFAKLRRAPNRHRDFNVGGALSDPEGRNGQSPNLAARGGALPPRRRADCRMEEGTAFSTGIAHLVCAPSRFFLRQRCLHAPLFGRLDALALQKLPKLRSSGAHAHESSLLACTDGHHWAVRCCPCTRVELTALVQERCPAIQTWCPASSAP